MRPTHRRKTVRKYQASLALDKPMLDALDELARQYGISRTEVIRRLLAISLKNNVQLTDIEPTAVQVAAK